MATPMGTRLAIPKQKSPAKRPRRWDVHIVLDKEAFEHLARLAERDDRAISNLAKHILMQWLDKQLPLNAL